MTLDEAIRAAGMTPPARFVPGRWLRFPGVGKGKSNRAGWCRVVTPTLAIFGDWSSDLRVTWRDALHRDDAQTEQLLKQARDRERAFAREQRARQLRASQQAIEMMRVATVKPHPYLARKGFPAELGLVTNDDTLLIPMRDVHDYQHVVGLQLIDSAGEKKFLPGTRARGGIYRLGSPKATRVLLCEGYATGLSLDAAARRLPGPYAVVVCFSAGNLERVAESYPSATVCADNDESGTGERAARATGLKWTMPRQVGDDFNDLMLHSGLFAVVRHLQEVFSSA